MRAADRFADPVDVLIADDDAPARTTLRFLLEEQGYRCAEAQTGREALDLARERSPRCVLLDLKMPELDGYAVARQLRADPRTRAAHIHCLTGQTDPAARAQAHAAGCEMFLAKPVHLGLVLQLVNQHEASEALREVAGLTPTEAEDWLAWLEANGYPPAEVVFCPGEGFTVREKGR